ncbi:MAG: hypothetical protein KC505_08645 [Myxococcales bacterium]|nr:hypothetical protein [Myxococcales bacterium]USN51631.1 MAG: hypothetical protein H6731_04265 [Myxococcales bacterium]
MSRLCLYMIIAWLSSCGGNKGRYEEELDQLRLMVNSVNAQMSTLGFPVNTDTVSLAVENASAMSSWFNDIRDESRQENKNYVASAPPRRDDKDSRLAFYDPNTKTLVFRDDVLDKISNAYLAHELAHIYQDQRWGLKNIWRSYQDAPSPELFNITQYMIEGYAELVRKAYEQKYSDNSKEAAHLSFGLEKLFRNECVVCRQGQSAQNLPYTLGLKFLLHQYQEGGWPLVEHFLKTLPASTEQILHPSKLKKDSPKQVSFPLWKENGRNAELILDAPMGEASLLSKLLSLGVPNFKAFRSASGWDGDQAQIYLTNKGEKAMLWRIVFDREMDAKQLADTLEHNKDAGHVERVGRVVDWVSSSSPGLIAKLKIFLSKHPQEFGENYHDSASTEMVELKAVESGVQFFNYPNRARIVIGPKKH